MIAQTPLLVDSVQFLISLSLTELAHVIYSVITKSGDGKANTQVLDLKEYPVMTCENDDQTQRST